MSTLATAHGRARAAVRATHLSPVHIHDLLVMLVLALLLAVGTLWLALQGPAWN